MTQYAVFPQAFGEPMTPEECVENMALNGQLLQRLQPGGSGQVSGEVGHQTGGSVGQSGWGWVSGSGRLGTCHWLSG